MFLKSSKVVTVGPTPLISVPTGREGAPDANVSLLSTASGQVMKLKVERIADVHCFFYPATVTQEKSPPLKMAYWKCPVATEDG